LPGGKELKEGEEHESSGERQENLRQMQGDPPAGRGAGDLRQPEAQAAARVVAEFAGEFRTKQGGSKGLGEKEDGTHSGS
jgi:hypothetical protein